MKGRLKWFKADKKYGFITGEDNYDYFFYVAPHEKLPLSEECVLCFEVVETEKGKRAEQIVVESEK